MDDVSQRNALADRLEDFSVEVQEISAEVIGDMMRRGEPDAEAAYLATAEARNLVASLVAYAKRVRSGDFSEGSVWRGSRIAEMDLLPLKEVETDAGTRS